MQAAGVGKQKLCKNPIPLKSETPLNQPGILNIFQFLRNLFDISENSRIASEAFLLRSSRLALITQSKPICPFGKSGLVSLKVSLISLLARFLSCALVLSFFEAVTPKRFIPRSFGRTKIVINRPSKRLPSEYTRRKSAGLRSLSSFVKRNLNNGMGSGAFVLWRGDA